MKQKERWIILSISVDFIKKQATTVVKSMKKNK